MEQALPHVLALQQRHHAIDRLALRLLHACGQEYHEQAMDALDAVKRNPAVRPPEERDRLVERVRDAMRDRKAKFGLATMCIGAGQGIATIFESVAS